MKLPQPLRRLLARQRIISMALATCATLASCSGERLLVDTPNVFRAAEGYPVTQIPAPDQTTTPEILFVTDRQPTETGYSSARSASMAFGTAQVRFGDGLSWKQLVAASQTSKRSQNIQLTVPRIQQVQRFPETPLAFEVTSNGPKVLPDVARSYKAAADSLRDRIEASLQQTNRSEVFIYVHGVANSFDASLLGMADLWHFTGRATLPIAYSWPAGNPGALGYFRDREGGEFTVFHFKEFLRIVASTSSVRRIHIVAHSRGTGIATTGLRELIIEERAAGRDPRRSLKVQNLILAAPDLDFGIVRQRLMAERFGPAFGQITVYINAGDSALGLAQRLMTGQRFGRIGTQDLSASDRDIFARVRNVAFVDVGDIGGFIGHSYFRENPAVLSDIALVLRTDARPGTATRPLQNKGGNFWLLPPRYPSDKDPS